MPTGYILCNGAAGNSDKQNLIQGLEAKTDDPLKLYDVRDITNFKAFFDGLQENDFIILVGGDGTLNRFVNHTEGLALRNEVLYVPCGTGNDFARDLGYSRECDPISVSRYISDLPRVKVNGLTYRFVNGIGYGIDGYCCEVGDRMKRRGRNNVNYASIAVRGLLFHYKPKCAKITVDGVTHEYHDVWLAPTMNGRYYGGGMMPTPEQKRNSGLLSVMVFHCPKRMKTLSIFPSLFKGEHIRHEKQVDILRGKRIVVEFDRPAPLQIDGETIRDVRSYTAWA